MSDAAHRANLYGVSVLGTAAVRMWRAWRIVLVVVGLNALAQGALVAVGVLPYLSLGLVLVALVSFAVLVLAFALVAVAMLQAVEGPVLASAVFDRVRARWWPLLAWAIGLTAVVTLGLAAYVVPALAVIAITPYLLLAVIDERPNPLAENFRVLAARWGRWLVTVVIVAGVCGVLWLGSALAGFFLAGPAAAIAGWLVLGLVSSWVICVWALLYRTVNPSSQRRS